MSAACLDPAVIVRFRGTAGFFPQEADRVFGLSVNTSWLCQSSAVPMLVVCAGLWEGSAETRFSFF